MDWLEDFQKNFDRFEEVKTIKDKHIHGTLEINFVDGYPNNYNLKIHRRSEAVKKV